MRPLFSVILIALTLWSCEENPGVNKDLINRIPTDSKIIIHTDDLNDLGQLIKGNQWYEQLDGLSRLEEIEKASSFLSNYDVDEESLIALSIEGKNEVVITLITAPIEQRVDSTKVNTTIDYNNAKINKHATDAQTYYSLNHNGAHLASSSRLVIESLIRRNIDDYIFDDGFKEIYKRTNNGTTFYVKASEKKWLEQFLLGRNINDNGNHALWYQLELRPSDSHFQMDGVITYKDSLKMDHDLYNQIKAVENQIQEIAPTSLNILKSVTYKNPTQLIDNLKRFHSKEIKIGTQLQDILDNTQEMTEIALEKTQALVFTLKPYEAIFLNLDSLSTAKFTYRDQTVYELDEPIKTSDLKPLIQAKEYRFVTVLGQHLILSSSPTAPEEFISNFQNNTVLGKQDWWQEAMKDMSSSSSLLKITSTKELKRTAETASSDDVKLINKINESEYPLLISQFVHEDEYAHYHFVIPQVNSASTGQMVSQIGTYKSPTKIITGPFLFPNHLNKKHDVAFQDESFKLHLLSDTGKKLWSKALDGPILGAIEVTDAYKNGRKQMVLTTTKSLYFIDRNGKDVNTYPKTFKDPITQPVSVFDYDKKRNYRFLVTQNNQLTMFDRDGKEVKGFQYKKGAAITSQPKHFRVGTKDYIAFAKADQTLSILNRTGKPRTTINEKIDLKSELFSHKNKVVALTAKGDYIEINLGTGKLKTVTTYGEECLLSASDKTVVIQYNNDLIINGEEHDLPYGSYLPAQVSHLKSGDFIHLVETGENRVYIFDRKGEILPYFPVYGKTKSEVAQSKSRYLTTLDGDDIIIYKW
ncbi:putative pyrroloquinoline-quinone binding quinoprotein [Nonlabens dokdonensis]|uniref:Ribonuclease HII n=2 Tax=Nonlabens dokdonensis TaxID=328515 RepID=L7WBA0_NONDD|nr:PQQ-binding-like beta-propeller repeat protein [Nonlabens dokdonensis]AGC77369.1 ribonuclease HII [Nonlabens dokdonensis DSW-6]PZX40895.1 putative pyrroloquinoline-quinone binding quinoprotein [Nonlabens dokdonensis]